MGDMKHKIYQLLGPAGPNNRSFNIALASFIILNVISAIVETVPWVEQSYGFALHWFELVSVVIFSVEYGLRVWVSSLNPKYQKPGGVIRYMLSPFAIIDLLAVAPSLFSLVGFLDLRMLRTVRLFRLLRIFKLARYSQASRLLFQAFVNKKPELTVTMAVGSVLILFSSTLMYLVEHAVQPDKFSSIPATMWWAIATLSTVGYGDIYPVTSLVKMLGSLIAIIGVGLFALPAAILASSLSEISRQEKDDEDKRNLLLGTVCPYCQAPSLVKSKDEKRKPRQVA